METRRVRKPIDVMNTLDWTEVIFTPAEKALLSKHGNDLIKSGLIVDYLNAFQSTEDFSIRAQRLKDQYAELLVQSGLPHPQDEIIVHGDDWRHAGDDSTFDDLRDGEAFTRGASICRRQAAQALLSRQWFFFKIYETCDAFLLETNVERKFDIAARLGDLLATLELRHQQLGNATRGEKVIGGAKNSALKVNNLHADLRARRFSRMAELVPSLGPDKAAAQCEIEGLGAIGAIKRQWNRHRKKRDT